MIEKQVIMKFNSAKLKYTKTSIRIGKVERSLWKNLREKYGEEWETIQDVRFNNPELVYNFVRPILGKLAKEEFHVMHLNNLLQINCYEVIAIGGITSVKVNIGDLFATSLLSVSPSMIVCHNHPSGDLNPSKADLSLTENLLKLCQILDRKLEDHVIVGSKGYQSIRSSRLIRNFVWDIV